MTELIGAYTHKQAEKIVELNNACTHTRRYKYMVTLTDTSAHKKENGYPDAMDLLGEIVSCKNVIWKESNDTRNKATEVRNNKNELGNMMI